MLKMFTFKPQLGLSHTDIKKKKKNVALTINVSQQEDWCDGYNCVTA